MILTIFSFPDFSFHFFLSSNQLNLHVICTLFLPTEVSNYRYFSRGYVKDTLVITYLLNCWCFPRRFSLQRVCSLFQRLVLLCTYVHTTHPFFCSTRFHYCFLLDHYHGRIASSYQGCYYHLCRYEEAIVYFTTRSGYSQPTGRSGTCTGLFPRRIFGMDATRRFFGF